MTDRQRVDTSAWPFGLEEMWVENEHQFNEALQRRLDRRFGGNGPEGTSWVVEPMEQKDGRPTSWTENGTFYQLCESAGLASEAHAWTECLRMVGYLIDQAQGMTKTQLLWRRRPEVRGDNYLSSRAGKWSYTVRLAFE